MRPLSPRQVWWERVSRAVDRREVGDRVVVEWCHGMLEVLSAGPGRPNEIVPGVGWQEIPPERCTDEYKCAEAERLCSHLGRKLGVGEMPPPSAGEEELSSYWMPDGSPDVEPPLGSAAGADVSVHRQGYEPGSGVRLAAAGPTVRISQSALE